MKQLDQVDLKILKLLQADAKYTNKEIASQLNLTITPVFERIRKLEEGGFIKKYRAILDSKKLGFSLVAFCNISLKEHAKEYLIKFESEIRAIPEVVACYHIAGMFDYLLKVVSKDINSYQKFIVERLATLENIGQVQSSFVMKEIKSEYITPI